MAAASYMKQYEHAHSVIYMLQFTMKSEPTSPLLVKVIPIKHQRCTLLCHVMSDR